MHTWAYSCTAFLQIKDGLDYLLEMLVDGDYDSAEGIEDDRCSAGLRVSVGAVQLYVSVSA